jgi:hypothetical protein
MKPYDDTKIVEANSNLEETFKKERELWQKQVSELVESIKFSNKLTDAMVMGLSYRQQIIEKIAYYRQVMYKRKSHLDVLKADRYRKYTVEGDLKMSASEKNDAVAADLTSVNYQISLLQNQIEYLSDTNQTLTNFQFAVKNKITIITEEIM